MSLEHLFRRLLYTHSQKWAILMKERNYAKTLPKNFGLLLSLETVGKTVPAHRVAKRLG